MVILELVLGLVKDFLKNARRTGGEVVSAIDTLVAAAGSGDLVDSILDIVLAGGGGDGSAGGDDTQVDDDCGDGRDEN